ncbi:MAG: cell division protein ZapA [Bacteroidota bacterium]
MEELAVNIRICDRVYPMKVQAADEARVRAASKRVNEQVKAYRDQFGIKDQQDLLAMVAFDCLIDTLRAEEGATLATKALTKQVSNLIELVDQTLPPLAPDSTSPR